MLDAITNDASSFAAVKAEGLVGKDKKLELILKKESWLQDNQFLTDLVYEAGGKKVRTTLEGLLELENLSLPQVQHVHDHIVMREWNCNPHSIENNDVMLFSAGGIMWGGIHIERQNDPSTDIETKEQFRRPSGEQRNSAKFHLLPIGVDHHLPGIARSSASLIAIDMNRFLENITSYSEGRSADRIHFLHGSCWLNSARFLHKQYGFRIARIWDDSHVETEFPGWEILDKIQAEYKKAGNTARVSVDMFCTEDDLLNRVWENANNLKAKVTESEQKKYPLRYKYKEFEISLRKLAISIRCTKREIVDSPIITDWQKIHAPDYSQAS